MPPQTPCSPSGVCVRVMDGSVIPAAAAEDAQAPARADNRSLSRGLAIFAVYSLLYIATLIDALAPFPLVIRLGAAIGNGICMAMLFIIGHDCAHGTLVPGRRLNLWLGRLAFMPIVH